MGEPKVETKRVTARAGHATDLYGWAVEQAALLRAGRLAEIDAAGLAEEIDDVGNEQLDKLESALRVLLLHMLKWDHQPARRSRSWTLSIAVQRRVVARVLKRNPSLKPRLDEAIAEAYGDARLGAALETRLPLATFPETCAYDLAAITGRPFEWDPA